MAILSVDKKCACTVCTGILTTDRKKNSVHKMAMEEDIRRGQS
jgi:hypothetical protein